MVSESRGYQTVAIVVTFTTIALLTVVLRCVTRFGILKVGGLEDALIIIAMTSAIGTTVCQCLQVQYGSGRHVQFVTLPETIMSLKYLFASIQLYNFSLTLTKLAILILYRKVFLGHRVHILSNILIVVVILYGLETLFAGIFTCIPVKAYWDITIKNAKCVNEFTLYFANAGINILTDCSIFILPLPSIAKLQIPRRRKTILMMILSLGAFTCLTTIIRIHALYALSKTDDPTWEQPATAYWASIECNMGIVCACLPVLSPLIGRCAPGLLERLNSGPVANTNNDQRPREPNKNKWQRLHIQQKPVVNYSHENINMPSFGQDSRRSQEHNSQNHERLSDIEMLHSSGNKPDTVVHRENV